MAFLQELGLKRRSGTVKSGHTGQVVKVQNTDGIFRQDSVMCLFEGSVSFHKGAAFQTSIADALMWPSHAFQSTVRVKFNFTGGAPSAILPHGPFSGEHRYYCKPHRTHPGKETPSLAQPNAQRRSRNEQPVFEQPVSEIK